MDRPQTAKVSGMAARTLSAIAAIESCSLKSAIQGSATSARASAWYFQKVSSSKRPGNRARGCFKTPAGLPWEARTRHLEPGGTGAGDIKGSEELLFYQVQNILEGWMACMMEPFKEDHFGCYRNTAGSTQTIKGRILVQCYTGAGRIRYREDALSHLPQPQRRLKHADMAFQTAEDPLLRPELPYRLTECGLFAYIEMCLHKDFAFTELFAQPR